MAQAAALIEVNMLKVAKDAETTCPDAEVIVI